MSYSLTKFVMLSYSCARKEKNILTYCYLKIVFDIFSVYINLFLKKKKKKVT